MDVGTGKLSTRESMPGPNYNDVFEIKDPTQVNKCQQMVLVAGIQTECPLHVLNVSDGSKTFSCELIFILAYKL